VIVLRPIRFGIVGILNTVVGLGVIVLAKALLDAGDLAANILGYCVGFIVSFHANRRWTFSHQGGNAYALARFVFAFALSYAINLVTVFGLRDVFHINSYLAQAAGVIPYTFFFYILCAYFVFSSGNSSA